MMKNHAMRLSSVMLVAAIGATMPAYSQVTPKCGAGSAIDNARINAAVNEQNVHRASEAAAKTQTEAVSACQIAVNTDVIRTAIPDALNGIATVVKNFNPAAVVGGLLAKAGSQAAQEAACKVANNVIGAAGRSVVSAAGNAVNGAVYDATKDITNPINSAVGAANGISASTGAGVYAGGVTTPQVINNTGGGGASYFDTMACKAFHRC